MTPWWVQAERLDGDAGEIAGFYLAGPMAREYTPDMVAAAMQALGIDCTAQDVLHYRTTRKKDLERD